MDASLSFAALVTEQRRYFRTGATLDPAFRTRKLLALHDAVRKHEADLHDALRRDLGKGAGEAYLTETGQVLDEVRYMARKVGRWAQPRRAGGVPALWPASSRIHPEPLGVTLIFSPWNYPVQLALLPLAAAVAAGNCAVLKPSSSTPATAEALRVLVEAVFDPAHVALVKGGPHGVDGHAEDTATALLRERFDFIFYTGSARVGRIITAAAAPHLTPVCLELGGKSPAIVTADAPLDSAAKRIAWGKSLNAGQTCIAPDHVWVDKTIKDRFQDLLRGHFTRMAGVDPLTNDNYGRIVSAKAFDRLIGLAARSRAPLRADRERLKIAPCVFEASPDDAVMAEEIFGPLLPVLPYEHLEDALNFVRDRPKPLALYLFTRDKAVRDQVLRSVPFGGGCVNDVVLHAASRKLPFGGVGESGMGRYHGRAGFDLFSNLKSVVHQRLRPDIPLRYPPYSPGRLALLRKILR